MKVYKGKMVEGKKHLYPTGFVWGGMVFVFWYSTSWMIPLFDGLIEMLALFGMGQELVFETNILIYEKDLELV